MRRKEGDARVELETTPGLHLSANGDYRKNIEELGKKYPNLLRPERSRYSDENRDSPKHALPSRVACFEFDSNGNVSEKDLSKSSLTDLDNYLRSEPSLSPGQTARRRLYILEGTHVDLVAVFGAALRVEPSIFLRHKRVALWNSYHECGDTASLPTLLDPQRSFLMQYRELLHLEPNPEDFYLRTAGNERDIAVSRRDGEIQSVGITQRKASFWARKIGNGGWDGRQLRFHGVYDLLIIRKL
jgi:hypothetical protein